MSRKRRVLFICTHNSARSQMAEGLLQALYGEKYEAYSAGTEPRGVHPYAAKVMGEIGIDLSRQRSKSVAEFHGQEFDYVITVCDRARETCPIFAGGKARLHEGFQDPAEAGGSEGEKLAVFRKVRDEIKNWIARTFG